MPSANWMKLCGLLDLLALCFFFFKRLDSQAKALLVSDVQKHRVPQCFESQPFEHIYICHVN